MRKKYPLLIRLGGWESPSRKRFYCKLIPFPADRLCWQQFTANSSPFRPEKWGYCTPQSKKWGTGKLRLWASRLGLIADYWQLVKPLGRLPLLSAVTFLQHHHALPVLLSSRKVLVLEDTLSSDHKSFKQSATYLINSVTATMHEVTVMTYLLISDITYWYMLVGKHSSL